VREPPAEVDEADLLAEVRRAWDADVVRLEHLPVGFGAHHWAAYDEQQPRLFVTFDRLEPKRTADRLEAAYAGAAALHEEGLEFVLPSLRTGDRFTRPFAGGAVSCTPWRDGTPDGDLDLPWTAGALHRLHAATPLLGPPPWVPAVGPDLAETVAASTEHTWGPGPYADRARDAVRGHLCDLAHWTARYHLLAAVARTRTWVATHGEPDEGNQLLTAQGRLLVDWESLQLAPAERDLRTLVGAGADPKDVGADPEMLELFDLGWRLDEINEYAAWFAAPHQGTADDDIAFGGLMEELERP
jgi:spectinomycin phosphotransferase